MKSDLVAKNLLTDKPMKVKIECDFFGLNSIEYHLDESCPACGEEHDRALNWKHASATSPNSGHICAAMICPNTGIQLRGIY